LVSCEDVAPDPGTAHSRRAAVTDAAAEVRSIPAPLRAFVVLSLPSTTGFPGARSAWLFVHSGTNQPIGHPGWHATYLLLTVTPSGRCHPDMRRPGHLSRFPTVGVTSSQRLLAPERMPSVVATGAASVDQAVHALGTSSWILVTDSSGEVTFIDGR